MYFYIVNIVFIFFIVKFNFMLKIGYDGTF